MDIKKCGLHGIDIFVPTINDYGNVPHRVSEGLRLHAGGQVQGELLAELGGWVTALVEYPVPHPTNKLFSTILGRVRSIFLL